jgi:hypothetical protein
MAFPTWRRPSAGLGPHRKGQHTPLKPRPPGNSKLPFPIPWQCGSDDPFAAAEVLPLQGLGVWGADCHGARKVGSLVGPGSPGAPLPGRVAKEPEPAAPPGFPLGPAWLSAPCSTWNIRPPRAVPNPKRTARLPGESRAFAPHPSRCTITRRSATFGYGSVTEIAGA